MAYKVLACIALLAVAAPKEQSRWSRQISSYTADISDWVPLTGPVEPVVPLKRQAVAEPRILSEPFPELTRTLSGFNGDTFPSRSFYNSQPNRQLYLQSVPSAPQNYLTEQGFGQGMRFGLSQPNFPLTQGFIAPQYNFDSVPQFKPKPLSNTGPVKFDSFSQALPPLPSPAKPFLNQAPKLRPEPPKFVDGYRVENNTDLGLNKRPKPQSLHKIRFDNYDKSKEIINTPRTKVEREEVQLLYVPLESLNKGQFNFRNPITAPQILNSELYNQVPKQNPLMKNLAAEIQRPTPKPVEEYKPQEFSNRTPKPVEAYKPQDFSNRFNSPPREIDTTKYSTLTLPFTTTVTTPKPKLKPHQPPLAIFLTQDSRKDIKVGDVLSSLKNARTVPVLDSVNPLNAPEVFIGPSSLNPPDGFVKFELPYLSNIENKDKKLKQLPFFVAPLSYNTPQGFAKIPFPSPHVGSVVINSQIQESSSSTKSSTVANVFPNSYTADPFAYDNRQPVTQKPKVSYYSTAAPKENVVSNNYKQNYYSFEPQTVSTIRPQESSLLTAKPGTYFINRETQFSPSQYVTFPQQQNYQTQEPRKVFRNNYLQDTTSTTQSTTITTRQPSTHSTQLLETHNPYSINQGLQFNAPSEYQNFFDEYKESSATTQGYGQSQTPSSTPATVLTTEVKYEQTQQPNRVTPSYQQNYQQDYYSGNVNQNLNIPVSSEPKYEQTQYIQSPSPSYEQNYEPDIYYNKQNDYESYRQTPTKNVNEYPEKTVSNYNSEKAQPQNSVSVNYNNNYENVDSKLQYNPNVANTTQSFTSGSYSGENKSPETESAEINSSNSGEYNNYNVNYSSEEQSYTTTTTTTTTPSTTTTSKRTPPLRTRGRPKYPTKSESNEYSTRATAVTRRPLRERRPSTSRSRYEPNKFVTEKSTKESYESNESTTKSYRQRTRGKIHYKPSEGEETYEKQTKNGNKMGDLAYQRDILHQNYPVTLMERASTIDIEAITEPIGKSENAQSTNSEDTANAFSNDELAITEHNQPKETVQYISHEESGIHADDVPLPKNQNYEDYLTKTSNVQLTNEDGYSLQTSPQVNHETEDLYERNQNDQANDSKRNEDRETEAPEIKSIENQHIFSQEEAQQDNAVETTPSYNRVRIRPGVIRQHHQTSTTESSKIKNDRKNNAPITYRPAFDKRRTTMRIEEIEADLKTKQIHARPEFKDYRQPVYKPDPTTEATSTTTETTTKRGQFRRKRPTYTTTSTEGSINRRPYEAKNRFRGRRPTEKPTEKPDIQLEDITTTARSIPVNKYRSKFSERFNKKPAPEPELEEITEDQDPNYSIHRPKYAAPESDHWSPKFSGGAFKPFNPNDIDNQHKEVEESNKDEELDIITVGHDEILISVTPATNNRVIKKVPDIPPTLEALVEQTKVTKSEPSDTMSTFETMLEEVMKSLEEQDEDEYTNKVMKHKGGEIGEIPPERIISSGDSYAVKSTTPTHEEITTSRPKASSPKEEEVQNRRRGYWKKVKVRPVSEGIETAESQYYSKTVNRLGQSVPTNSIDQVVEDKPKFKVTTYKPQYSFIKNLFDNNEDELDVIPEIDIPKINATSEVDVKETVKLTTESFLNKETPTDKVNPGEMDLGTGSPDPTYDDTSYYSEPTEPTSSSTKHDRSDRFSFMDYLFGVTSSDENEESVPNDRDTDSTDARNIEQEPQANKTTTESSYIPEEFTAESQSQEAEIATEAATSSTERVETSSISSFMDPRRVISTSMSTEISHETEICFRGKCIKTLKDLL
ncbi:uncharacterized protein LOC121727930 [Aricia agestis]|uniref:uncharacterized protein LOC121727930 n=1 Tax=Aricia agestis TaxID=91739 RepID=UPI001C20AE8E|nr:uncharacterized protein LOC121727930 [Aricia agestis]